MRSRDVLRAVEQIAPSKVVTITRHGALIAPEPVSDTALLADAHKEEVTQLVRTLAKSVLDELTQEIAKALAHQVVASREMQNMLVALAEKQDASSAETSAALRAVAATLAQPVRPVYDKNGKLIGAQRAPGTL